ncbi:MAG: hypothetical protein IKG40_00370 [Bacilli bacterium]|nr:hypothetical protein [Bacilli bacterium]
METKLIKEIKSMKGTTLGIGINSEKIKNAINNNSNIKTCYLLEESSSFNKKKFKIFENTKTINIKKIKKVFKKKRIDNLICNYQTIKPFIKTFVRDSVFINKGKLYIYGSEKNFDEIINKYKRYTEDIKIEKDKDNFLIIINNQNTVNKKIKDIKYWWQDTLNSIADILTSILVN